MDNSTNNNIYGSMETATRDGVVVSRIVAGLSHPYDLLSASLVCKAWNDAITWETRKLSLRSRTLLPSLISRFQNVRELNLTRCSDHLQDSDLQMLASSPFFKTLIKLFLGNPQQPQECISNLGFVKNFAMLEQIALSSVPNLPDSGIAALVKDCKRLTSLTLDNCDSLSDDALEALSNCKSLRELRLRGSFAFTPMGLSRIGENCPMLLKVCLELDFLDISLAVKSLAIHCQRLEELSLKFRQGELKELTQLSTLISLHIDTDQHTFFDVSLASIAASNTGLKEFVFFSQHYPLSNAALTRIVQNCKHLEKFCVIASSLTDSALLCIMECKALKFLALHDFCSRGHGLAAIGLCGMQLKEFSLRYGKGIRDVELETLMMYSNKELEHIDLHGCSGPSSRGFSAIGLCSNLQSLDLSFTSIDDLSLATIANGAKMLRHLSLVKCEGVSDMKVLSNFRALEYLNVDRCPFVTDEGLGFLAASCSKLCHLSLALTRVTDIGLFNLTSCNLLQSLRIPYCRDVQGPGLKKISTSCKWIQSLVLSHRFRNTPVLEELRKHCCMVQLEVDEMALVPFDYNAFVVAGGV